MAAKGTTSNAVRRLTLFVGIVAVLMVPLMANAAVKPDSGYGSGGSTVVRADCGPRTALGGMSQVGYGGRVFVLDECAGGPFRLVAVGSSGQVDPHYGVGGTAELDVPQNCRGTNAFLRPARDGSVYLVFVRNALHSADPDLLDAYLCIAHVTPAGTVVPSFGGTSPYRHLNRLGGGVNNFVGAAQDSYGRLVVFTTRDRHDNDWRRAAVFINRYTTSGQPDATFSGNGQRYFRQRGHLSGASVGVYRAKPVIAIAEYGATSTSSSVGTAFVRFTASGRLDKTFSDDGVRIVRAEDVGQARLGQAALDSRGRLVFTEVRTSVGGGSGWCDLFRLTRAGKTDRPFSAATARLHGPTGSRVFYGFLQISGPHYVVTWQLDTRGKVRDRTTGLNADGSGWSAFGTFVNAPTVASPAFAPDRPAFYRVARTGPDLVDLRIDRFLVQ